MSDLVRVAVDAMGGDYAPVEPVKGAVEAVNADERVKVQLVGQVDVIEKELQKYTYPKERVEIVPATEIIETGEPPVNAIRHKKDSSIVVGMKKVRCGEADAFVSSGSTGAVLVGGQTLLIDCGANVDARPSHLVQFAMMGSIYMEHVVGIKNPRVGIVNIGVEEEKGNALVKETYPLLKENPYINFVGSIEAREIPNGAADVVVCEAFVGNVILKLYEGVGATLISKVKQGMMTSLRSKIGALLVKPALKETLKSFDASEYGGAPLLGLKGLVVKTHGSSKANEFKNSILQCISFSEEKIPQKVQEHLADYKSSREAAKDGI